MPNLMTPLRGRRFVVHSKKKTWTKPTLRTFENPEAAAAFARGKTAGVEKEKVEELLEHMRSSQRERHEPTVLRASARK